MLGSLTTHGWLISFLDTGLSWNIYNVVSDSARVFNRERIRNRFSILLQIRKWLRQRPLLVRVTSRDELRWWFVGSAVLRFLGRGGP
jgi:hypothetical protein